DVAGGGADGLFAGDSRWGALAPIKQDAGGESYRAHEASYDQDASSHAVITPGQDSGGKRGLAVTLYPRHGANPHALRHLAFFLTSMIHRIGIILNGVTGRMGTNQHYVRSILA